MTDSAVISVDGLSFPWETSDPFLFCVYHKDRYPRGNDQFGPDASLAGRNMGQDFEGKDGWRMYHGQEIPGFPQHPHRGFETVTVVRQGVIDHADSLGAAARFRDGDTQWLTAGRGIVHAEMFPLLNQDGPNPLEFFQIWLNLPGEDKFVEPHFEMLWNNTIPIHVTRDEDGRSTTVDIVAGQLGDSKAPPPPPKSWASRSDTDVAIWTIRMEAQARWTLPPAAVTTNRTLYFYRGSTLNVAGTDVPFNSRARLRADTEVTIQAGDQETALLLLQGRPIEEPVVQYGPFVMNSQMEIQQAFADYQQTQFGGWPWRRNDPVHSSEEGRYARHADGKIERAE